MIDQKSLRKEIDKIENNLRKYAFNQSRRFFLKGDQLSNAEDIYSIVYLKFFTRYQKDEHEEEFLEIIENNILERFLKVAIRNMASDIKDLQKHDPTRLSHNTLRDEDGHYTDPTLNIIDYQPSPDRVLNFRKILKLLKNNLDERQAMVIYYKFEKNMTFAEVSKILGINLNTLQTIVGGIRQNNNEYNNLNWDDNE